MTELRADAILKKPTPPTPQERCGRTTFYPLEFEMPKKHHEFTLSGKTAEGPDGKWGAEIVLSTPDGKETKINSGFVYKTDADAGNNLKANIDRIVASFEKEGAKVTERTEGVVQ